MKHDLSVADLTISWISNWALTEADKQESKAGGGEGTVLFLSDGVCSLEGVVLLS